MTQLPDRNTHAPRVVVHHLFASRAKQDDQVIIGGLSPDESEWSVTLTRRAAIALWYDLTRLLFPEKSEHVIGQVSTIPSMPRFTLGGSEVTSWVFVTPLEDGGCEIAGWSGRPGWVVRLDGHQTYQFWAALDTALYPTGW